MLTDAGQEAIPKMAVLAAQVPGLQARLFRLLSEDIGKTSMLAGDYSAEERLDVSRIHDVARIALRD
jgi:hypothetical protein